MLRKLLGLALTLAGLGALILLAANAWVVLQAAEPVHDIQQLKPTPVALVLGTSPYASGGGRNRHFAGRMQAAARLYKAGVVKHILASGANPTIYYNEPQQMLEALVALGVPETAITLDFAGRRTLDSVARAKRIFQLDELILVSQAFHLYRAMYLADQQGLRAQGFAAPGPGFWQRWRVELREYLARLLALADTMLLGTEPEVLGQPEPLKP